MTVNLDSEPCWDEVVEFLKARGVDISVGSLRGYLSPGSRKQKSKRSATRKRAPREAESKAERSQSRTVL
jgi:hypothetical protein